MTEATNKRISTTHVVIETNLLNSSKHFAWILLLSIEQVVERCKLTSYSQVYATHHDPSLLSTNPSKQTQHSKEGSLNKQLNNTQNNNISDPWKPFQNLFIPKTNELQMHGSEQACLWEVGLYKKRNQPMQQIKDTTLYQPFNIPL